ncbi:MAG: glutamate synthase subunit alpha, partial [Nitrospinae bacterium]|nr:glutamate synthase subunit alpha [Nitrospinota bacterium]
GKNFKSAILSMTFSTGGSAQDMEKALEYLFSQADKAIEAGSNILILSDREAGENRSPLPALLSVAGLHHHLIRRGTRMRVGLVVESGEPREMMHFALLIGYGAGAVCPYLAYETVAETAKENIFVKDINLPDALKNYIKSTRKGLFKIIAKMGISTIQSYRGA